MENSISDGALIEAINPKSLSLIILPTEKCNFRCTYCYEDFQVGRMSSDKILAIKRLLQSRIDSLRQLKLGWFGGEPLAASDIVLELSEFAQNLCQEHGVKLLAGDITTNGSLLDEALLRKLVALNQRIFQISLDGWQAGHDNTRRHGSGGGTFDSIWSTLLMMRQTDLNFATTIRIHLTDINIESVKQLAHAIVKEFSADKRFDVFLKPIENLGGPNAAHISTLSKADRITALAEIERILEPIQHIDAVSSHANGYICYASKPNNLVIRANGQIAKCTVAFDDPKNQIGTLQDDGTLSLNNQKLSYWFRGLADRDEDILSCPVYTHPHEKQEDQRKVIALTPI